MQVGAGGTTERVTINSQRNVFGQMQIGNPSSDGETSISFESGVTAFGDNPTSQNGPSHIWVLGAGSWVTGGDKFVIGNQAYGSPIVTVQSNGNVGIGTTSPSSSLAVNGTIRAKEVIVTVNGWSDYVFKPDYNLKPLNEVDKFIKKNHHLENVPSEKEVITKGVSMGVMQAKLLQKLEETTLYLIEMKKENEDLKARLAAVEQKVK